MDSMLKCCFMSVPSTASMTWRAMATRAEVRQRNGLQGNKEGVDCRRTRKGPLAGEPGGRLQGNEGLACRGTRRGPCRGRGGGGAGPEGK
eukprot:351461-Chlamydomonas_euryale.AAC.3